MERAFGLLKSRWRILLKQNEKKLKLVARTVTAAAVMHNQNFYEPDEEIDNEPEVNIPPESEVCDVGEDIRNAICDYLVEQGVIYCNLSCK